MTETYKQGLAKGVSLQLDIQKEIEAHRDALLEACKSGTYIVSQMNSSEFATEISKWQKETQALIEKVESWEI